MDAAVVARNNQDVVVVAPLADIEHQEAAAVARVVAAVGNVEVGVVECVLFVLEPIAEHAARPLNAAGVVVAAAAAEVVEVEPVAAVVEAGSEAAAGLDYAFAHVVEAGLADEDVVEAVDEALVALCASVKDVKVLENAGHAAH